MKNLLTSNRILISDDIKVLKEITTKFYSKLIEQENRISSIATSFEERIEKTSVSNRFGGKMTQTNWKLKQTFIKKPDIQDDNIENDYY